MEPILFRRPIRTPSLTPQLVGQSRNGLVRMLEMLMNLLRLLVSSLGMLQGLPGALLPTQVILFTVLLGRRVMSVRRQVV